MAWLPLYADANDIALVVEILNADPDIAFIIKDSAPDEKPLRWKAVREWPDAITTSINIAFWHTPSGKLPLFDRNAENPEFIENPWSGWQEKTNEPFPGAPNWRDYSMPYFGSGWLSAFSWSIRLPLEDGVIRMSSFEWIGNYFSILGRKAHPEGMKWWRRLRSKIAKMGEKIGRTDTAKPEVNCLPGAGAKIARGCRRAENPF